MPIVADGGGFWNPEAFDIGEAVLLPYLTSQGVRTLQRVFLSHAHADHMNDLISLLRYIPARQFYVTRQPLAEPGFQRLITSIPRTFIPVHQGYRWMQDELSIQVLAPSDSRKTLKVANDETRRSFMILTVLLKKGVSIFLAHHFAKI